MVVDKTGNSLNGQAADIYKNYSVAEASKLTGMSQSWFRQRISKREIAFLRIGGRVFLRGETLVSLLENGIVNPR